MHGIIGRLAERDNPRGCVTYFDKIALRTSRELTRKQMTFLREHARSVDQRRGHPIRNSGAKHLLTVVGPDQKALEFIAARSNSMLVNYVECALDIVTPDKPSAVNLVDVFDNHFVQPRHGRDDAHAEENGTYTKRNRPGIRFVWYGDRLSKKSNEPCLHVECRAHGLAAVSRVGICSPHDLPTFNHAEFWKDRLTLYTVDRERLGRWHENKRQGERRQRSERLQFGKAGYSRDRSLGAVLYRIHAETREFKRHCAVVARTGRDEVPTDKYGRPCRLIERSVQRFIDTVGRGPFLKPFDIPLLCTTSQFVVQHKNTAEVQSGR